VPVDTTKPVIPVPRKDSLALAKQARDSAADASVLEALAAAHPPEIPSDDADTPLRDLFDIDVANWMDHHRVKYYLDFFTGPGRERMGIWLERMPKFEPTIRAKLIASGLPGDLAYLPLIESGYSASAVSRARAVGMWQFMRGTARLYGLQVDNWVDERRDVVKATNAAIHFLADLTTKFGSPYLAAAAYNGGPGRIMRGLARIEGYDVAAADESDDEEGPQAGDAAFFQLADTRHLMRETKDYVPKLIAAAMIAKQPQRYGFPAVSQWNADPLDSVMVTDATGLDVIAEASGVTLADLWAANPMYLRAVTPPKRVSVVRVPGGRGAAAQLSLDAMPASARLTAIAHHVKRRETTATIAKRYGLTVADLRASNPALATRAPKVGEALRIPGRARLAGWVTENRRVLGDNDGPSGGATHRVRRGETLSHLSARYHVSVAKLRAWNRLGSKSLIRAGQLLRVRAPVRRTTTPTS
jgi:membrane-bound lytic murein transglycosylase D